jgi:hypothetical protein
MNSEGVSGILGSRADGAIFFTKSPFRSTYFVLDSILLFLNLCLCVLILARHGSALSWNVIVSLLLGVIALILPWQGALRLHRTFGLHDPDRAEPGLRLCLGHFANWIHYGLFCTYIAGIMLLGALSEYFIRQ